MADDSGPPSPDDVPATAPPGIDVTGRIPPGSTTTSWVGRTTSRPAGIRQFLDVGSGLSTASNVHEVAQGIAPQCRVVYVDNDPIVLASTRARLTSHPDGGAPTWTRTRISWGRSSATRPSGAPSI